jgi:hypothetical protein
MQGEIPVPVLTQQVQQLVEAAAAAALSATEVCQPVTSSYAAQQQPPKGKRQLKQSRMAQQQQQDLGQEDVQHGAQAGQVWELYLSTIAREQVREAVLQGIQHVLLCVCKPAVNVLCSRHLDQVDRWWCGASAPLCCKRHHVCGEVKHGLRAAAGGQCNSLHSIA